MKATEFLKEDHATIRDLIKEYREAEGQDISGKRASFEKIRQELEVHAQIEEKLFYPTVKACSDECFNLVEDNVDEHKMMEDLLGELTEPQSDDEFISKMGELLSCVDDHFQKEENELFPKVEQAIDAERHEELGNQLEALKADYVYEGVPIGVYAKAAAEETRVTVEADIGEPSMATDVGTSEAGSPAYPQSTAPEEGTSRNI
ncbi:MAG: hemerythrin domain-containing protein [Myxococcota bacterium]